MYNRQGPSLVTTNLSIVTNVYEYYPLTPLEFLEGNKVGIYFPLNSSSRLCLYEQRESGLPLYQTKTYNI